MKKNQYLYIYTVQKKQPSSKRARGDHRESSNKRIDINKFLMSSNRKNSKLLCGKYFANLLATDRNTVFEFISIFGSITNTSVFISCTRLSTSMVFACLIISFWNCSDVSNDFYVLSTKSTGSQISSNIFDTSMLSNTFVLLFIYPKFINLSTYSFPSCQYLSVVVPAALLFN